MDGEKRNDVSQGDVWLKIEIEMPIGDALSILRVLRASWGLDRESQVLQMMIRDSDKAGVKWYAIDPPDLDLPGSTKRAGAKPIVPPQRQASDPQP